MDGVAFRVPCSVFVFLDLRIGHFGCFVSGLVFGRFALVVGLGLGHRLGQTWTRTDSDSDRLRLGQTQIRTRTRTRFVIDLPIFRSHARDEAR